MHQSIRAEVLQEISMSEREEWWGGMPLPQYNLNKNKRDNLNGPRERCRRMKNTEKNELKCNLNLANNKRI